MLIAQITDLHIGPTAISELNDDRLSTVVDHLTKLRPDVILATGDLTESGDAASYARLRSLLEPLDAPILFAIGNHDLRIPFSAAFPDTPMNEGFVQYAQDFDAIRIVVLDTLEEGRHGGAFCEDRAAWLVRALASAPERPTLIVLHHPPFRSGIGWMDAGLDDQWTGRLASALQGQTQVIGLVAGHIHRPIATTFAGRPALTASSTAPQVALDLEPTASTQGLERPLIVAKAPGFALHLWTGSSLLTHFASADDAPVLAWSAG